MIYASEDTCHDTCFRGPMSWQVSGDTCFREHMFQGTQVMTCFRGHTSWLVSRDTCFRGQVSGIASCFKGPISWHRFQGTHFRGPMSCHVSGDTGFRECFILQGKHVMTHVSGDTFFKGPMSWHVSGDTTSWHMFQGTLVMTCPKGTHILVHVSKGTHRQGIGDGACFKGHMSRGVFQGVG